MDHVDRDYVRHTLGRAFAAMLSLTGEREGEFLITNKALSRFLELYSNQFDDYWAKAGEETLLNYWERQAPELRKGLLLAAERTGLGREYWPKWAYPMEARQRPPFVISADNVEAIARLCPPPPDLR